MECVSGVRERGGELMRLDVLGPLRVCRGGEELDLGFPQQRALLALLVVRAGRPVPVGEIVDVLWPGRAPASARNVVRRYAGSLRRLLEPGLPPRAPGRRLLRRAGGYLLEAGEDEVDLLRFRALTKRGKRAAATGRSEAAARHFTAALDEWRGPVAMGIPAAVREHVVFAEVERELVRTTRMAADAALLSGNSEQVLPRLRQALELDPLDESLHAALVMALAATGLQAEALTAYERVRRLLATELGVTPGTELATAHTRVLRQEWGPTGPHTARGSADAHSVGRPGARTSMATPEAASGTDAGAAPGTDAGRGTDADTAMHAGADTGTGTVTHADARTGTNAATDAGAATGTDAATGTGADTDAGADTNGDARPATDADLGQPPPGPPVLVGRRAELGRLAELTDAAVTSPETPTTVLISGMPGIGKTALAVHWAHQVAPRFPDGQLHVTLREFGHAQAPSDPAAALRELLTALGVPPARMPDRTDSLAGLYRSLLAGRRLLVVLDDAADTEQVRPLLPASPGCLTLVTSRHGLPGLIASGTHPLRLDLPSAVDARATLAAHIGHALAAAEPEAADEIVTHCARLPLALTIAATRTADHPNHPLKTVAAELRHSRGTLDAFTADTGDTPDLRAAFAHSYRRLSPEQARLFRLLSLHPGPASAPDTHPSPNRDHTPHPHPIPHPHPHPHLTPDTAAALAGLPPRQARLLLDGLADAHLVTEYAPGRYALHELLRVFAAESAETYDSPEDRRAARRRLFDHEARPGTP